MNVIYEDNHLLIVDKPSLLPTMGVSKGDSSLISKAKDYIKKKYQKPGNVYLGVVSRLDSWVSGVIVLARTSKAAARLNDQFAKSNVSKIYLAIVDGEIPESGELENWVAKNERLRRMECVSEGTERAKFARLRFRKIGQYGTKRLLEIELLTGRKHQIRLQLSDFGFPILGDVKYDSELQFPKGISLHSLKLKLEHPTLKEELVFKADPPSYWDVDRFK
ncbi:MAG: RNA pseudouridine synthase [Planctomycetota bacterium]